VENAWTRRLIVAGVVLVLVLAGAVVALTQVLHGSGSAVGTIASNGVVSVIEPPPPNALVLAREAGPLAVALAVQQRPRATLTATVIGEDGSGSSGLRVSFHVRPGNRLLPASPCGVGCYRAVVPTGVKPRQVTIVLPDRTASFTLPASSRPGAAIVRRASRVYRGLSSLVYLESLRSGPEGGILTKWSLDAPDRVAYSIRGGPQAIVIGERRWDRDKPTGPWTRSSQIPALKVPQPAWGQVTTDARVIGQGTVEGRPVWLVTFVNPNTPAWFTAWIDRENYRTLRLRMTAASHFMFHRYLEFDRRVPILPPT
jgi:hypothetical protein